jgi:hypothetical protein
LATVGVLKPAHRQVGRGERQGRLQGVHGTGMLGKRPGGQPGIVVRIKLL